MIRMKKLQILRVDNDTVEKADLQIGNNFIGRSVVIGNDDIKNAVTINLSPNNEMTITPNQVSPCYMKSAESSRWQLLKIGATVPIKAGDICSLVSNKCWFKIVLVPEIMEDNQENVLKRQAKADVECDIPNKKPCPEFGEGDNLRSPSNVLNEMKDECINISKENLLDDKTATDIADQNFKEIHSASFINEDTSNCKLICKSQDTDQSSSLEENVDLQGTNETTTNIVTGPQSSISMQADNSNTSTNVATNAIRREKCKYGKKCYRRNAQHKAEFSHPEDSDYDIVDDRKECSYGMQCYRKNPEHRMQYKHTVSNEHSKRRKQVPRQIPSETLSDIEDLSADESVDESEYNPSSTAEYSDDSVDESEYNPSNAENSDDDDKYFDLIESEWES
ncbi:aprataxin and PNK-like factor isoform X2 [Colletes gigas]|uniref:aprataxin and PNK-like factor isoform X2 n=1 Tax=Colletes gigas TaxID=935657 RepID=UPI001C9B793D|nr:aprataxin and PNK-like factor isoform X2 [Colletes gigas]